MANWMKQHLRHMVDWHIEQGTHGIVPVGNYRRKPNAHSWRALPCYWNCCSASRRTRSGNPGAGSNNPLKRLNTLKLLNEPVLMQLYMSPVIITVRIRKVCISISNWYMIRQLFLLFCTTFPPRGVDIQPATMARLAEITTDHRRKRRTWWFICPWTERQLIKNRLFGYPVKMQLLLLIISAAVPVVFR